jgi:hypothetical protein
MFEKFTIVNILLKIIKITDKIILILTNYYSLLKITTQSILEFQTRNTCRNINKLPKQSLP